MQAKARRSLIFSTLAQDSMKTSQKILSATAAVLLLLLLSSLAIFRKELKSSELDEYHQWEELAVGSYQRLEFSPGWLVRIEQGEGFKVAWAQEAGQAEKPQPEEREGVLYFGPPPAKPTAGRGLLKITAPRLQQLKTSRGTIMMMHQFSSDSLQVVLEEGGRFWGEGNKFDFISLQASGDATYRFFENEIESLELAVSDQAQARVSGNRISGGLREQAAVWVVGEVGQLNVRLEQDARLSKVDLKDETLEEW